MNRLWTVVRFPNGSWSYGGKPTDPDYAQCEVWQIKAESSKDAIKKAQAKRSRSKKLSFGEEVFMKSVLAEAGRADAGTLVSFDHTEGRAVSGLEKKGLVVRLDDEVRLTDVGAAWLATATV
ncbi:hypothetical protein WS63_07835 [Burkholderia stagnalis]|uniref:hypothetical protein n=1 Tax=Burkholderia stagnalis TaxID=1503054 RepID=UPI000753E907|nr:hypothetical protein [Burkholderia stagnalis]KVD92936.1 hypothetical protein WS63_07835 [Burkholderia stagnalis]